MSHNGNDSTRWFSGGCLALFLRKFSLRLRTNTLWELLGASLRHFMENSLALRFSSWKLIYKAFKKVPLAFMIMFIKPSLLLWPYQASEYDSIVVVINSRPYPLSLEEVCGLFLDFELWLISSSHQQLAAAFLAISIGSCGPLSALVLPPSTGCGCPPTVGGCLPIPGVLEVVAVAISLLAETVIVTPHRLPLLPMLFVTDVGILITRLTYVGLQMMLSNLPRPSMQWLSLLQAVGTLMREWHTPWCLRVECLWKDPLHLHRSYNGR